MKKKDIITLESAIAETELQIERLTGTLRKYDALVDYATVNLQLQEVYRLANTEEPVKGFGSRFIDQVSRTYPNALLRLDIEEENDRFKIVAALIHLRMYDANLQWLLRVEATL